MANERVRFPLLCSVSKPGRLDTELLAKLKRGLINRKSCDGRVEVKLVSTAVAFETLPDILFRVDAKDAAPLVSGFVDRTRSPELSTGGPHWFPADFVKYLGDGNVLPESCVIDSLTVDGGFLQARVGYVVFVMR